MIRNANTQARVNTTSNKCANVLNERQSEYMNENNLFGICYEKQSFMKSCNIVFTVCIANMQEFSFRNEC